MITSRLHNLDYLRGLAAFAVMIHHYDTWNFGEPTADSFTARIGVYGVAIFYILSGLTLYHVYHTRMKPTKADIIDFARKRFFRIFPLLWLATICTIILSRKVPSLYESFLNFTGLFGLLGWDNYIATGAWSIGNELVFYLFFPVFIFLTNRSKIGMATLSLVLFGIFLYFAFYLLDSTGEINAQWRNYVNPLNQVFLFLSGYLIGLFFKNSTFHILVSSGLIIAGFLLLTFYPAHGDSIALRTNMPRLALTFACLIMALGFFKFSVELPKLLHNGLSLLGEASYSVYILHPIVFIVMSKALNSVSVHLFNIPIILRIIITVIATLISSYFVYNYFEKYFMKFGKKKELSLPKLNA